MNSQAEAKRYHMQRLRELESRLLACQSAEAEEAIQKQIDAEKQCWATVQQTTEGDQ